MEILQAGIGELIQPPDMDAFRAWNRNKPKSLVDKRMTEAQAVEKFVFDGAYIGTELYGTVRAPMSITREILRQGKKDLRLAGQGVLELDLLMAASLVKTLDLTYIGLEVYGISNVLRREVESGRIEKVVEWSNGSIVWRFKAASMGVPFLPTRSMLGSDTLKYSAAKVVECPFTGDPIALIPALILDVGIIHVHRADMYGNCQVDGIEGFCFEMARASKSLIVSTEKIIPTEEIRQNPDQTIIPYYLVDAVVEAPYGSHPGEMCYEYERDEPEIKAWVEATKTPETTQAYLDEWVYGVKNHEEYLQKVGSERLAALSAEAQEKR
ncbi:MAG: CoA-transferase [Anaerolineales bacterium]|jgi:acyl CoA:acetate/3-ketoacid CoA transferase alpha subunit